LRTLRASYIGSVAAQALSEANSETVGEIIHTFPNSLYMKTTNQDLLFITIRQLKSPITINLESTSNLGQTVKPFEPVSLRGNGLHIGESTSIVLSSALPYNNNLATLQIHEFEVTVDLLYIASLIFRIIDTNLSVLDPAGLAHNGVRDLVAEGIMPLRETHDHKRFCEQALKIVGLGGGFTPSGNDFLGGFLAIFNSLAHEIAREKVLLDFDLLESKTNWVNAKLLDYMQRQVLDDQIDRLIGSATSGDGDEFIIALETLLPRGHTSGIDISVGVVLAISLVHDIISKRNETSAIAKSLGLLS
jgi:hypothetical protein